MEQQEEIRKAVALKAAVEMAGYTKEISIVEVLNLADKFLIWLRNDITLPQPTLQEKKILDAINAKLGLSEAVLYEEVLNWAEKVVNKRIYPSREESIQKFIDYYRREK